MDKKLIKQIITTVCLIAVIVAELFIGVRMVKQRSSYKTDSLISLAKTMGTPNTTIENNTWYEEVPEPEDGDVVKIGNVRIKLSGEADDTSSNTSQYIIYADLETRNPIQFSYMEHTERFDLLSMAIANYFDNPASTEGITKLLPVNVMPENLTFYQQSLSDQNIPVVYDNASDCYYMFYPDKDSYYVFSSKKPFKITTDKVTVHYKDPNDDPLRSHTYSAYEVNAVENTLNAMDDDDKAGYDGTVLSNTTTQDVANNYTTEAASNTRNTIVSYAGKKWNKDGTSVDGNYMIDLTSNDAKASEWVLKSEHTSYSYTTDGLNLTGLQGKRDSAAGVFELSGKIQNLDKASRPYALAVIFVDSTGQLLGVKVVDNRTNPIEANGVSEFSVTVNTTADGFDVADISSVMFKLY